MSRAESRETRDVTLRLVALAVASALAAACGLSPIDHRIKLGEEPFVVFVGEGIDHNTDLFTTTTGGGPVFQLTFTTVIERAPRLSASGGMVAFLRIRDSLPGTHRDVVVMNLQNGAEKVVNLPEGAGTPLSLGWGVDDSLLYIRTSSGYWRSSVPPSAIAAAVAAADSAAAFKSTGAWLGRSGFAEAIACGGGLCIVGPQHDTTSLTTTGHDPMRWGVDSVGWFEGNEIVVRPLGPGRTRRAPLKDPPGHPREGSVGGKQDDR